MADAIQELKLVLSLDTKAYQAGLKGAKASLLGLSSAQVAFGMAAAQYAMRGIDAVVRQYKEYDQALDKLSYQVTDFNKVSRAMMQANTQTTASLRTVGEAAAIYGSRLEMSRDELTKLTAVTAQYADDTGDSAGAMADSVAGLSNRWIKDAGGIASALGMAGQMSGQTISALGDQMMDATPFAKALGMEFEELLAQAVEFKRAGVDFGLYISLMEKNFEKFGGNATEANREIKLISNTVQGFKTQAEAVGFLIEQGFSSRAAIELAEALRSQTQVELDETEKEIRAVSDSLDNLETDVETNIGWWERLGIAVKKAWWTVTHPQEAAQEYTEDELQKQIAHYEELKKLGYSKTEMNRLLSDSGAYEIWDVMRKDANLKKLVAPGKVLENVPSTTITSPSKGTEYIDWLEKKMQELKKKSEVFTMPYVNNAYGEGGQEQTAEWSMPAVPNVETMAIAKPMMTDMNPTGWNLKVPESMPYVDNAYGEGGQEKTAEWTMPEVPAFEKMAIATPLMTDMSPTGWNLKAPEPVPYVDNAYGEGGQEQTAEWTMPAVPNVETMAIAKPMMTDMNPTGWTPKAPEPMPYVDNAYGEGGQEKTAERNIKTPSVMASAAIKPSTEKVQGMGQMAIGGMDSDVDFAAKAVADMYRVEDVSNRVTKQIKGSFREAFVSAADYADSSSATMRSSLVPAIDGAAAGVEEMAVATEQAKQGVSDLNQVSEDTRSTWEKVADWATQAAEKMGIDPEILSNNIWTGLARVGKESLIELGIDVDGLTAKVQDFFVKAKGYGFDINSFWEWAQKGTGQTTAQIWNQTLDQMAKATGNFIMQASQMFATGTVDWKELFGGLWRGILASSVTALAKMVAEWIAGLEIIAQAKAWLETMPGVGAAIAIGALAVGAVAMFAASNQRTAMAKGGLVTGPTNALIGEAGPEAVFPLEKLRDFGIPYGRSSASAVGSVNGGPIINITVNNPVLNNRTTEKDVRDFMDRMGRQMVRKGGALANSYS